MMWWRTLRLGDIAAIVLAVVVIGGLVYQAVEFRGRGIGPSNWGFGPEWECTNPGKGEPVCLKKTGPEPTTAK